MGRPTKYKAEFCDKLIDFYDREPYEDIEMDHYDKTKGKDGGIVVWTDIKRVPCKLPILSDFAKSINVGVRTVYDWIDEKHSSYHEEFSQIYTRVAKALQKAILIQNGLQGLYNPHSFKFVAINITDMRDVSRKELTGEDGGPIEHKIVSFADVEVDSNEST